MSDEARILMAQHAKTSELLGVDFLPLGRVLEGLAQVPSEPSEPSEPEVVQTAGAVDAGPSFAAREPVDQPTAETGGQKSEIPSGVEPISMAELRGAYEKSNGQQAQLDALKAKYELESPHRYFNTQFKNIVFGEGDPDASLMFIGEAPGEDEDLSGRPFVGRAGQLLENMIKAMGQSRESVYICNVLKTRPVGNATPTGEEAGLCMPYLLEQIRIVSPRVIVTLGLSATHVLLNETKPMRGMRGHWHGLAGDLVEAGIPEVEVMPTYHPAYLLRSYTDENRRKVWSDLTQVIEKLKG